MAIRDCKDRRTERFLAGERVATFQAFADAAAKALTKLQAAVVLGDLRLPRRTGSRRCMAIDGGNSASGSILNTGFVSHGCRMRRFRRGLMHFRLPAMPMMSRLPITTDFVCDASGSPLRQDVHAMTNPIDNLPPIHPGRFLRDELEALGMSARKFAATSGCRTMRSAEL